MSLSSFLLVIFDVEDTLYTENRHQLSHTDARRHAFSHDRISDSRQENSRTMSFDALTTILFSHSNIFLFMLFFVGFGIKAGFIPLHTWLPEAHPAAPSHVSGVMSGVMIKMGIYGILRVFLVGSDRSASWIGILITLVFP